MSFVSCLTPHCFNIVALSVISFGTGMYQLSTNTPLQKKGGRKNSVRRSERYPPWANRPSSIEKRARPSSPVADGTASRAKVSRSSWDVQYRSSSFVPAAGAVVAGISAVAVSRTSDGGIALTLRLWVNGLGPSRPRSLSSSKFKETNDFYRVCEIHINTPKISTYVLHIFI